MEEFVFEKASNIEVSEEIMYGKIIFVYKPLINLTESEKRVRCLKWKSKY